MRRLVLMRHAKAERGEGKPDFDRTLEPRGWSDGECVGATLAALGVRPDTVLCSSSRRTRDTLAAILPHIRDDCTIGLARALYEADEPQLRDAVRRAQGQCILLIGHNPAVHELARSLAGSAAGALAFAGSFPTAAAALFTMGFALDTIAFERFVTP